MITVKNCHGLEIRGSEKPNVQGTQESNWKAARHSLNVASTVGFFQPRISNPWLLLRHYVPDTLLAHFLSTRHIDRLTGHIGGIIRGEKDGDIRDIFIGAAASQRHLRFVFRPHFVRRQALRFGVLTE